MPFWKKKKQQKPKPKPVAHAKVVPKSEPKPIPPPLERGERRKLNLIEDEFVKNPEEEKPKIKCKEQDARKEFMKVFKQLTYRFRAWEVWQDFIVMFACALSNPVDKANCDEREKRYLRIIKKYNKSEQQLFPELAAQTVLALEDNPEQDFLGGIFMELNLGEKKNGQFFTPYHVCELMAQMAMGDISKEVEENGYITIHDPCCGAGSTLIAGVHEAKRQLEKKNLNYQNHVLVVAQDVDETVALMCYIQLSLLGVAAYIKVGDTFTEPIMEGDSTKKYWFTPMYFMDTWHTRRTIHKMMNIMKGENKNER